MVNDPDVTPVARWEFRALAIMLVATHGDLAQQYAEQQLADAERNGHAGERVTWREVLAQLPLTKPS